MARSIGDQFRGLDPKDPGRWPIAPRVAALFAVFILVVILSVVLFWRPQQQELKRAQREEVRLRGEWVDKKKKAINKEKLIRQLHEIDLAFGALLKQLPNKTEMEALLVDINQAGIGRGLNFDLFRPGNEVFKEFYAELPITLSLNGEYRDFGNFAADIAKLPRIVTLNDIVISHNVEKRGSEANSKGTLQLTAVAKTFRYLSDQDNQ